MKAKQNNTKKFIDPATFPHVAGLLGNKNRAKAWLTTETAINFSQRYFFDISKRAKYPFRIHFSDDNRKRDGIPTFAFNPFLTCPGMPCLKPCYATKGTFLTVNKLKTEVENTAYYFFNRKQFLKELDAYLTLNEIFFPYFRYFEGGGLCKLTKC